MIKFVMITDIILMVKDRVPLRIYTGYENTGNNVGGSSRILAGLNIGNLFYLDHRFDYQFMTAPDIAKWQAHSFTYTAPLPWREIRL